MVTLYVVLTLNSLFFVLMFRAAAKAKNARAVVVVNFALFVLNLLALALLA